MNRGDIDKLKENMIFVGTIYDSFEALEETLGKLKLEKPLFITHIAKMAFAEEVFKRADEDVDVLSPVIANKKIKSSQREIFN
jgi:hypothetical protein